MQGSIALLAKPRLLLLLWRGSLRRLGESGGEGSSGSLLAEVVARAPRAASYIHGVPCPAGWEARPCLRPAAWP